MRTSPRGKAMIQKHEARMGRVYDDARPEHILHPGDHPVGKLTAGYGHTGSDLHIGLVVTDAMIEQWLTADLQRFEVGVSRLVTRPLNQNQFDALIDFSFNVGLGAFGRSTLLERINDHASDATIAHEFGVWIIGQGRVLQDLVGRRADEVALWETPV